MVTTTTPSPRRRTPPPRRRAAPRPAPETTDGATATTDATADTSDEATDETTETTATDGGSEGGSATTFPQPEGEPDPDASFIYGYPITVSRLDPHRASISQDATTLFPVYDRLVHLSPTGDLIPGLAESWEFSDDGLTLTLHVRPDVTFHDGAALDAEAVKANLDRGKSIEGSSVATDLAAMESVTVVDPMTVEVKLSTPNVAIIGSFADRAGIIVSPQAIADGVDLDANMVGAGPYKMVSHVHGDSTKYERNDDYWDQEHLAPVKNLEIKVIADNVARLNAIRTGQISATTISAAQAPEVEGNEDLRLMYNTELAYTYIVQNRARGGQDDVRVRQAMMYGLDRQSICDSLLAGKCQITDQPFPPGYFAYNEDIPDVLYPYDPEKAKELLAEAGVDRAQPEHADPGRPADVPGDRRDHPGPVGRARHHDRHPPDRPDVARRGHVRPGAGRHDARRLGRPAGPGDDVHPAGRARRLRQPRRRDDAGDGRADRPGDVDRRSRGARGGAQGGLAGDGRVGARDGHPVPAGALRDAVERRASRRT